MTIRPVLGVGVIGVGAVAQLRHLPAVAEAQAAGCARLLAVADVDPARAAAAATMWGASRSTGDIADLLATPGLDAVIIATPNLFHHDQALAALAAGKHVLCEKPLAMTLDEARAMAGAAHQHGLITAINFRYRWIPAARFVTDLIASGALGHLYHAVFHYFSGWLADPATPAAWRTMRAQTGSGALGDLGSHLIDLAASWLGEAQHVRGRLTTFVRERPTGDGGQVSVDVDDAADFTVEYAGGTIGHFLATRNAHGRTNHQRIELYGSQGAVTYEFERWDRGGDQVQLCLGGQQATHNAFATITVSPEHLRGTPSGAIHEFFAAIKAGRPARPNFDDGLRCQEIMSAVERSDAAAGAAIALPLST